MYIVYQVCTKLLWFSGYELLCKLSKIAYLYIYHHLICNSLKKREFKTEVSDVIRKDLREEGKS